MIALTAGCSGPTLEESLNPALGKAGCKPASPAAGPEENFAILGTPLQKGATASGLFFQTDSATASPHNALERKFVVSVSGEGDLGSELIDPSGEPAKLAWGPEPHTSSNFDRPGDEWDLGLKLDEPGCWNLQVSRGGTPTADFWFEVG